MLDNIQSLFWASGYSATSLDDIMKSTGLGKGRIVSQGVVYEGGRPVG